MRALLRTALLLLSVLLAVLLTETALRLFDGYEVTTPRLTRRQQPPVTPPTLKQHLDRLPPVPGLERDWFALDPPTRTGRYPTDDAELSTRYWSYPGLEVPSVYEWNARYVQEVVCSVPVVFGPIFSRFDDVYVFEPSEPVSYPTFRFLRNATLPSGLRTNNFGWRGPDIPLRKPARSIRIAFVGASTTINPHGDLYAYPDYVRFWLNRWAAAANLPVTIEVINAGREGVNSQSIAAIARQELAAMEPDIVVYYEGSNQFWPADFVVDWPDGTEPSRPPAFDNIRALSRYSATVGRLKQIRWFGDEIVEPRKPPVEMAWPPELDEFDPSLQHDPLPVNLTRILADLDSIRDALAPRGGRLAVGSFVWLVYDGLRLNPATQASIDRVLNGTYWPFSYAHMRRMADFQNRVFAKYARERDALFIDIARDYPRDPLLFGDPIHMTPDGIRLMAWIVTRGLIPILARGVQAGELPRAATMRESTHPAFTVPGRVRRSIASFKAECPVTKATP